MQIFLLVYHLWECRLLTQGRFRECWCSAWGRSASCPSLPCRSSWWHSRCSPGCRYLRKSRRLCLQRQWLATLPSHPRYMANTFLQHLPLGSYKRICNESKKLENVDHHWNFQGFICNRSRYWDKSVNYVWQPFLTEITHYSGYLTFCLFQL